MTIRANGQWSVALDSSTPTGKLIPSNSTGNIMTVLRFKATGEPINISKIRLGLTNASSTGVDMTSVSVYDGSTLLASGVFNGAGSPDGSGYNASSTFTLNPVLAIAANSEKVITVKADIASMEPYLPVATAGHSISINYQYNTSNSMNLGTGQSSGVGIAPYSPTTAQTAVMIYRSVPTVSTVALSTNTLSNGTMDLYKFKVTADAKGDIDLVKFTFKIATTNPTTGGPITIKDITLVDVTDTTEVTLNATTTNSSFYADLGSGILDVYTYAAGATWGTATTTRTVGAGQSRTFVLRATLGGTGSGASVTTDLEGDAAAVTSLNAIMSTFDVVEGDASDDFIWSGWSSASHTTTPVGSSVADWTNGYLVSGLPSSNLAAQTLSK